MNYNQPAIYITAIIICMVIGGHIVGHIIFGLFMLGGIIALVENIPWVKNLVYFGNNIIDVFLFILSALAIVTLGVSVAAALAVASLGYTMLYAPYVRHQNKLNHDRKKQEEAKAKANDPEEHNVMF